MSFGSLTVGDTSDHAVVIGPEHFDIAERIYGDDHPIHVDDAYAQTHGHPARILPGSVITGLMTRSLRVIVTDAALALLELTVQFKAPVYPGDVLQVHWEVIEKRPKPHRGGGIAVFEGRCTNQTGQVVAVARALDLIGD